MQEAQAGEGLAAGALRDTPKVEGGADPEGPLASNPGPLLGQLVHGGRHPGAPLEQSDAIPATVAVRQACPQVKLGLLPTPAQRPLEASVLQLSLYASQTPR